MGGERRGVARGRRGKYAVLFRRFDPRARQQSFFKFLIYWEVFFGGFLGSAFDFYKFLLFAVFSFVLFVFCCF